MREILFRGKTSEGVWVYGDLSQLGEMRFVTADMDFPNLVEKDTVGQFIGLTDKNGKQIFEGDIVKVTRSNNGYSQYSQICAVQYDVRSAAYNFYNYHGDIDSVEVVGNIHDTPELLEVKK